MADGYRINTQKSVAVLYIHDKPSEKLKETIPFIMYKNNKYLE